MNVAHAFIFNHFKTGADRSLYSPHFVCLVQYDKSITRIAPSVPLASSLSCCLAQVHFNSQNSRTPQQELITLLGNEV